MPDYRGLQECYWLWKWETTQGSAQNNCMLAPSATTSPPNSGGFTALGYSSLPSFSINEQPVPIMSLGGYRLFNSYKGIRDYSLRAEITIGYWEFLNLAMRGAITNIPAGTATRYKQLPVFSLAFGSMDTYGSPLNWVARYCMIREMGISYEPGMPLRANLDIVPLYVEYQGANQQIDENTISSIGGDVIGWADMEWTVGGNNYTPWVTGINFSVSNGLQPIGQRRDKGDDNPLSRVRRAIVPTHEQVSVQYSLPAELPQSLINDSCNSTLWGTVVLDAHDESCSDGKQMKVTIEHNRLAGLNLAGGQIGQTLNFSASTLSGILSITGK